MEENVPKAAIIPRDPDKAHAYTLGVFDALAGAQRPVTDHPGSYAEGFSWGRLVFIRLCGETVGQAQIFLEVSQGITQNDSPDFDALVARLEELADAAEHERRQQGDPGTASYERVLARRDAFIDAKNLVEKCRRGETIR